MLFSQNKFSDFNNNSVNHGSAGEKRLVFKETPPENPPETTTAKRELHELKEDVTKTEKTIARARESVTGLLKKHPDWQLSDDQLKTVANFSKGEIHDQDLATIARSFEDILGIFDETVKAELDDRLARNEAIRVAVRAKNEAEQKIGPREDKNERLNLIQKFMTEAVALQISRSKVTVSPEDARKKAAEIVAEIPLEEKSFDKFAADYSAFNTPADKINANNTQNAGFFTAAFNQLSRPLKIKVLENLKQKDRAEEQKDVKNALFLLKSQNIVDDKFIEKVLKDNFKYEPAVVTSIETDILGRLQKQVAQNQQAEKDFRQNLVLLNRQYDNFKKSGLNPEKWGVAPPVRVDFVKHIRPERFDPNGFVRLFTLKNIFAVEFLSRGLTFMTFFNAAAQLDTLMKDPKQGLENIITNPYIWAGTVGNGLLLDNVLEGKISKKLGIDHHSQSVGNFGREIFGREVEKSDHPAMLVLGLLEDKATFYFIKEKFDALTFEERDKLKQEGDIETFFDYFYQQLPLTYKKSLDNLGDEDREKVLSYLEKADLFLRKRHLKKYEQFKQIRDEYVEKQKIYLPK